MFEGSLERGRALGRPRRCVCMWDISRFTRLLKPHILAITYQCGRYLIGRFSSWGVSGLGAARNAKRYHYRHQFFRIRKVRIAIAGSGQKDRSQAGIVGIKSAVCFHCFLSCHLACGGGFLQNTHNCRIYDIEHLCDCVLKRVADHASHCGL